MKKILEPLPEAGPQLLPVSGFHDVIQNHLQNCTKMRTNLEYILGLGVCQRALKGIVMTTDTLEEFPLSVIQGSRRTHGEEK